MLRSIRWMFSILLVLLAVVSAFAGDPKPEPSSAATSATPSNLNALVGVLVNKGVLTNAEAVSIQSAEPSMQLQALVTALSNKGIINASDVAAMASTSATPAARYVEAAQTTTPHPAAPAPTATPAPPAVTVAAAVAPLRPLPVDPPKKEGLIPGFKLGVVRVTPYGFIKSTAAFDSYSPRGDDFPLPGFLGDSGPTTAREFHLKARSSRVGLNFEWPDASERLVITGRLEGDFEGNFSRADNRNISSIRSSMFGVRLAFVRADYNATPKTSFFFEGGQDWTPFGSSTLPNLLESTGLGIGFGTLYERLPQFRVGMRQKLGGSRNFEIAPEFAIVQPSFGNLPTDVGNQLGFGERQGSDSERPEYQARVALQWQLDKAEGVAPAQFIVSGIQGHREAIVLKDAVPAAFQAAFPTGARVGSDRYGVAVEAQLPTRWVTVTGKIYRGADLRFFFAGQLFSNFNDSTGLTGTATASSVDGSSSVIFGLNGALQPVIAPQRPVRTVGGFVNLGLPLSRWFNANPKGRNAGWQLYLHYGTDQVISSDLRHALGTNGGRARSNLEAATLYYKLNQWCAFGYEQSFYTTIAVPNTLGVFPLVAGSPAHSVTDHREEFGPMFTF